MVCILTMACGSRHSLFLSESLSIWACGCNWHGQLGVENGSASVHIPVCIPHFEDEDVALIAASGNSSAASTTSSSLFVWGKSCPGFDTPPFGRLDHALPQRIHFESQLPKNVCIIELMGIAVSDGCVSFAMHC